MENSNLLKIDINKFNEKDFPDNGSASLSESKIEEIVERKFSELNLNQNSKSDNSSIPNYDYYTIQPGSSSAFLKSLESFNHSKINDLNIVLEQIKSSINLKDNKQKSSKRALNKILIRLKSVNQTRKHFLVMLKHFSGRLNEQLSLIENAEDPKIEEDIFSENDENENNLSKRLDFLNFEFHQVEKEIFGLSMCLKEQSNLYFERVLSSINRDLKEENFNFMPINKEKLLDFEENYVERESKYMSQIDKKIDRQSKKNFNKIENNFAIKNENL
ncbi:hypothetical protein MHBO_000786, partial [Bonamia ostreae]